MLALLKGTERLQPAALKPALSRQDPGNVAGCCMLLAARNGVHKRAGTLSEGLPPCAVTLLRALPPGVGPAPRPRCKQRASLCRESQVDPRWTSFCSWCDQCCCQISATARKKGACLCRDFWAFVAFPSAEIRWDLMWRPTKEHRANSGEGCCTREVQITQEKSLLQTESTFLLQEPALQSSC